MTLLGRWLRLWFTFESGVGRREYILSGVVLAAVKYAGDAALVWRATGRIRQPLDYLAPLTSLTNTTLADAPSSLLPAGYWALYGDAIMARIHQRVRRHIRTNAEVAR